MFNILKFVMIAVMLTACVTTGATFRSGVGDRLLEHPPYYGGERADVVGREAGRIGHLPIAFQRGASQAPIFDPRDGSGSKIDRLLDEMNAFLDSLGVSTRLVDGRRVSAVAHAATGTAPDVRFGCIPDLGIPGNDCAERGDSALGRGHQAMQLSVGRPAAEWITWNREQMRTSGTGHTLVVTLEVGQYLLRQEGLRGTKVLELGTGHRAQLPWLTSLETPVSVLQLTAALVDASGKALRIGAEGFYARRTRLVVSSIGGQELLSDEDVEAARSTRRADLPGSPLAWKVALRELVIGVTGRSSSLSMSRQEPPDCHLHSCLHTQRARTIAGELPLGRPQERKGVRINRSDHSLIRRFPFATSRIDDGRSGRLSQHLERLSKKGSSGLVRSGVVGERGAISRHPVASGLSGSLILDASNARRLSLKTQEAGETLSRSVS